MRDYTWIAQLGVGDFLCHTNGRKMHEPAIMLALGLRPGAHLPTNGLPQRKIGNVLVWVEPAVPSHQPAPGPFGRRKGSTHRVMCECPVCGWQGSAGRLHQHRKSVACHEREHAEVWLQQGERVVTEINRDLTAKGLAPLTRDQIAALHDAARTTEALEMLDDLEARCGISGSVRGEAAAYVIDISDDPEVKAERGDPNDCAECARSYGPHYAGPCEH